MLQRPETIQNRPRRPHAFVAILFAALLGVIAVVTGVSDHEEPGARYVVIECQGFDALASAGARRMSCEPGVDATGDDDAVSPVRPVEDRGEAATAARRKV